MSDIHFNRGSIAVLGASGQLGHHLVSTLGDAVVPFTRLDCDLLSKASIEQALCSHHFEWVINAAAYTNVDGAESDPDTCLGINHLAVGHIAEICQRRGSKLVQVSSDYVFGGDLSRKTPHRETDPTAPQGVYATSKLLGEQAAKLCDHHLILRTCGLYAAQNANGTFKNFCNTILAASLKRSELSIVNDQWCTPTYVPHLVSAIETLIKMNASGTYHVVNEGQTNWYAFGSRLLSLAGIKTPVIPISSAEYRSAVIRPQYSVLDTSKFVSDTGRSLPTWEEGLAQYVRQQPLPSPAQAI